MISFKKDWQWKNGVIKTGSEPVCLAEAQAGN